MRMNKERALPERCCRLQMVEISGIKQVGGAPEYAQGFFPKIKGRHGRPWNLQNTLKHVLRKAGKVH
ncbi:hypothetical protein KQX54_002539 [Cotesia glomerata]|uniref:Uncharacterized protein n=1 Tax=Cotesia glomerata TaxID=32391 RepID=A0AAV7I4W4_COTGL|nr:hypothetical protein KQX54_002539 [Cotesia glomerata]